MVMMSVAEQHSTVRGSLAGAAAVCTEHTTSTTTRQHYCQAHYFKHYLAALLQSPLLDRNIAITLLQTLLGSTIAITLLDGAIAQCTSHSALHYLPGRSCCCVLSRTHYFKHFLIAKHCLVSTLLSPAALSTIAHTLAALFQAISFKV